MAVASSQWMVQWIESPGGKSCKSLVCYGFADQLPDIVRKKTQLDWLIDAWFLGVAILAIELLIDILMSVLQSFEVYDGLMNW